MTRRPPFDPGFWRGRRVLITGHTGFKGGWLSLWLQSLGAELSGLALAPDSDPNLFTLARIGEGMQHHILDIRDKDALQSAVAAARPEVIFHLAAQALVRASYTDPVGTFATNVMGTVHLLEAVRQTQGVRVLINVTSDKCYANPPGSGPHGEDDPMGGHDPYSASKGCAELVAAAYAHSYFSAGNFADHGLGLASVRAGNTLGGGDWSKDRLIPDIIAAFIAGRPVEIRYPQAVRPWQHVLDPLAGYMLLAQHLWFEGPRLAGGWNFGPSPDQGVTVREVVDTMTRLWGGSARWEHQQSPQPYEAAHLQLDPSKAQRELSWACRLDVPELLALTIDWYSAWQRGEDLRRVTLDQIKAYQDRWLTGGSAP